MNFVELTDQVPKSLNTISIRYNVSYDLVQRINYKISILVRDTSDRVELEEDFA